MKMNRTLKAMLLLALIMALPIAALGSVSASDVIVVACDQCFAGNDYTLLLTPTGVKPGSMSDGDILYIDQITAASDGFEAAVVFPNFEACDAYLGGVFADGSSSPLKLGTYTAARTPAQLKTIEAEAFENSAFTHVFLVGQVTSIGARAFANCGKLAYVYIPGSVTSIADDAFDGCGDLVIGCVSGSKAETYAKNHQIRYRLL